MFDPKTLKTIISNGHTFQVSPVIYDAFRRADAAMFAATGKHIIINSAYRSTLKQAQLYRELKAKNPKARVAFPGKSFHERGQAIDVQNWQAAEPFLRAQGFLNPLKNDKVHFSIGEFLTPKNTLPLVTITLLLIGGYFLYTHSNKGDLWNTPQLNETT